MYNTLLEKQAFNAKEDVKSVIDDLMTEINELEEANENEKDKICSLEDIIEKLRDRIDELESKLDNSF